MPELPEVETIARSLREALNARTILRVETFVPKLRESLDSLRDTRLCGTRVSGVRRRGRYLVIDLEQEGCILMHFGMSGVLRMTDEAEPRAKHEHILFFLDNGITLRFECPRRFSLVKFLPDVIPGSWPEQLNKLGLEPLWEAFDGAYLYQAAQGRKIALKQLIMDNAVVTGVGNIYATEALFLAKLSPLRPSCELKRKEATLLVAKIKEVLLASIASGGTTFSDYRQLDGSEGKYLLNVLMYGKKEHDHCPCCGAMIQVAHLGGRSSAYCPKCQQ